MDTNSQINIIDNDSIEGIKYELIWYVIFSIKCLLREEEIGDLAYTV
jgi:hypothetical protein